MFAEVAVAMVNNERLVCAHGVMYAGKDNSIIVCTIYTSVARGVQLETQAMYVRRAILRNRDRRTRCRKRLIRTDVRPFIAGFGVGSWVGVRGSRFAIWIDQLIAGRLHAAQEISLQIR